MDTAKTILLAEHDPFLINVYSRELRKYGYKTSVVSDGKIILNRIRSVEPALMILDAELPHSESDYKGLSVLKSLRDDVMLKDLKVVMLHDVILPKNKDKFFRLGVHNHFSKAGHTAQEIVQEVKRILS